MTASFTPSARARVARTPASPQFRTPARCAASVAALLVIGACGHAGGDVVAPRPVDLLATLPGTYTLATVDGQRLPVETTRTAVERDTLVADTLRLSGRVDSSVTRVRVMQWFTSAGIGAGSHRATVLDYDGGWRVRTGAPFIWVLANPDSVPVHVPDAATLSFARQGHVYVYTR